jgi:hypothetical protein
MAYASMIAVVNESVPTDQTHTIYRVAAGEATEVIDTIAKMGIASGYMRRDRAHLI